MKRMSIAVVVLVLSMVGAAQALAPATVVGKASGAGKLVQVNAFSIKKPNVLWVATDGNTKRLRADYSVWCYRGAGETLLNEGSVNINVSRWARLPLPLTGVGVCDVFVWVLNPSATRITAVLLVK